MMDSHLPGIAAGLFLAAVVGHALFVYLKPLRGQNGGIGMACVALAALFLVKAVALHWLPPPMLCPATDPVVIPHSPAVTEVK
jgi:high-affinity Fe2+/Pb2+ permease